MQIRNVGSTTATKPYGVDNVNNDLFMIREIYNHLKSISDNASIKINLSSYGEFLEDMSALHREIIDGSLVEEFPEVLREINEYLGLLGDGEEYPIARDRKGKQDKLNAIYKGIENV